MPEQKMGLGPNVTADALLELLSDPKGAAAKLKEFAKRQSEAEAAERGAHAAKQLAEESGKAFAAYRAEQLAAFDATRDSLDKREQVQVKEAEQLSARKLDLDKRQSDLADLSTRLDDKRREISAAQDRLNAQAEEIGHKTVAMDEREKALDFLDRQLSDREARVEAMYKTVQDHLAGK